MAMQWELSEAATTRAGFWSRLGAAAIDGLIFLCVLRILVIEIGTGGEWIALAATIAYYVGCEGHDGQTLGKRALRIRVADIDTGAPIGYLRALVRYLASLVSALAIYLGYLWMLWDPERQTWHDKLSRSVVVPAW